MRCFLSMPPKSPKSIIISTTIQAGSFSTKTKHKLILIIRSLDLLQLAVLSGPCNFDYSNKNSIYKSSSVRTGTNIIDPVSHAWQNKDYYLFPQIRSCLLTPHLYDVPGPGLARNYSRSPQPDDPG